MRISTHISYKESVRSNTATKLNIANIPPEEALSNMQEIAYKIFEPLRKWVEGPIRVNSFYRSEDLNRAVGGSGSSQHCKGQALDLDDTFGHKTNAEMFNHIKDRLSFDQLIWEFGDDENPDWIHVSYVSEDKNRKRALRALKVNGRTQYVHI